VALGDGTTTSFWHDEWAEAGRLAKLLPVLYSHCLDTDATVEEVLAAAGMTSDQLQPRLSSTAQHELVLLENALLSVELKACPDGRRMVGSGLGRVCTAAFYSVLQEPATCPPWQTSTGRVLRPKR
jgi:hypothetical protein